MFDVHCLCLKLCSQIFFDMFRYRCYFFFFACCLFIVYRHRWIKAYQNDDERLLYDSESNSY